MDRTDRQHVQDSPSGRGSRPASRSDEHAAPQGGLHSLGEALDQLEAVAEDRDSVSIGDTLDGLGQHSFAPLLLIPGLIMVLPGPADIPGVPVLLGLLVIIVAVQMIMRREHLWVPQWFEKRRVRSDRARKMVQWLRRPAGWIDRLTKERYTWLIDHGGVAMVAIACILIAASTPVLEFVPFSANVAGAAITAFALALMARDGLVAGLAILLSVGAVVMVAYQFVG